MILYYHFKHPCLDIAPNLCKGQMHFKINTHQISNSQIKTQQSVSGGQSGRLDTSLNPSLAASATGSISPSESDLSGCSYSVRHKLHVSYSIIRLFPLIFPIY